MKRKTVWALGLVLALSACQTTRGDRYCLQMGSVGTLGGAAVGAGAGAGIAALAGANAGTGAIIGAIGGAIIGAASGCQYGIHVASRREQYDSKVSQLNAELANAQKTNSSLSATNNELSKALSERQTVIADLKANKHDARTHIQVKQALQKELSANQQELMTAETQVKNELNEHRRLLAELEGEYKGSVDVKRAEEYRKEIAALETEYKRLQQLSSAYAGANNQVSAL